MSAEKSPPVHRPRRVLPVLLVAVVGIAAGVFVASRTGAPPAVTDESAVAASANDVGSGDEGLETLQASLQRSQVLPSDFRTVPPFTLSGGDDGEPLTESVLDGRWSLMFFGYTNCPDVCPLTLSVMKEVVAELESDGVEPMQVLFVTVDPARDTPERVREYVAYFDEDFVGVSGERNAIHELTRALGIVAAFTANEEHPEAYAVDHTASMLLVDPERRVRATFGAPHEVESIVADYRTLRAALS